MGVPSRNRVRSAMAAVTATPPTAPARSARTQRVRSSSDVVSVSAAMPSRSVARDHPPAPSGT